MDTLKALLFGSAVIGALCASMAFIGFLMDLAGLWGNLIAGLLVTIAITVALLQFD